MTPTDWLWPALFLAAGLAMGRLYFGILRGGLERHFAGAPWAQLLAGFALRLGLALAVFWLAAQAGAPSVIAALLGFLAARSLALRRKESEA